MTEFKETELDERAIKMAKVLSADAVERAGHGHPGSPVSLAPIAYTLYQHFIKHDPNDPNWEGRDRFILSGGHASLTQYVQLYFSGYGLTLDDLKNFRGGADTRTPGHPEYGLTPGIEMTTGPLGQGFASAIGFAYGQRFQRGLLDPEAPEGESPFDHNIWVICGEGDIEEGISGEAASLAANQQLGNLTVIFDANRIQIEGDTNLVLAEDVLKRFQAYGWYTDEFSFIQPDGSYKEDVEGLADTIAKARAAAPNQPKLIKVDTLIAWPTPGKTNDPSSHGSKLGAEAVAGLKKLLGYDPEESFHVDEEALAHARGLEARREVPHVGWNGDAASGHACADEFWIAVLRLRHGAHGVGDDACTGKIHLRDELAGGFASRARCSCCSLRCVHTHAPFVGITHVRFHESGRARPLSACRC